MLRNAEAVYKNFRVYATENFSVVPTPVIIVSIQSLECFVEKAAVAIAMAMNYLGSNIIGDWHEENFSSYRQTDFVSRYC